MTSTVLWYLQGIYNFATGYLWNCYDVYSCYGNYGIYRDSQDLLMCHKNPFLLHLFELKVLCNKKKNILHSCLSALEPTV